MTRPVPYPADTKAKGWRFELDHERIDQSDTWALATPALRPWLLMTWLVSWKQIPCGSLPADDELIAARLGMDIEQFTSAKKVLMRGWWLADDGRLYHDTVVQMVQAMLGAKTKERDRKAAYRDRQATEKGRTSHGTASGHPSEIPGSPIGGDDTGTGTGTSTVLPAVQSHANSDGDFLGKPPERVPEQPGSTGVPMGRILPAQVCFAMKRVGMQDVNPSHPKLLALIGAGADVGEFTEAAKKAVDGGKGFAYALAVVEGQRKEAAALVGQLHTGPLPAKSAVQAHAQAESFRERDARAVANRIAEFAPGVAATMPGPIEQPRSVFVGGTSDVAAIEHH